jgi:hypothetical protein
MERLHEVQRRVQVIGDEVAAVATRINAVRDLADRVAAAAGLPSEEDVPAAPLGALLPRVGHNIKAELEEVSFADGLAGLLVGVGIKDEQSGRRPRGHADTGIGPPLPPRSDLSLVGGRAKFKLTPLDGKVVNAPLIGECLANIECKVVDIVLKHNIVIMEAVAAHIDASRQEKRTLHAVGDGTFIFDGRRLDRRKMMASKLPAGI